MAKAWMQPKCPTADEWIKKMYSLLQLKRKKKFLKTGAEEKRKVQRKTGEMRKKREGRDCVLLHRETTPPQMPSETITTQPS